MSETQEQAHITACRKRGQKVRFQKQRPTQTLDIIITVEPDGSAWMKSKAMKCSHPVDEISASAAVLVDEWLDFIEQ